MPATSIPRFVEDDGTEIFDDAFPISGTGPGEESGLGPPFSELPKPPAPYTPGWRFTVQSHRNPPPTPVTPRSLTNEKSDRRERHLLSVVDRCVLHPPLPGEMEDNTVTLEIVNLLQAGDTSHSQVFTVRVLSATPASMAAAALHLPPDDNKLVAKLYDPLYLDDDDGYINPFHCVDRHYTHEANTYERLAEFQGSKIPRFYGSYSLTLSVDSERSRAVRMILIEYVQGTIMSAVKPEDFPQSTRQKILRSIVDLESLIYEKDIFLKDLYPRNVILRPSDPTQVVFIDFGKLYFDRGPDEWWFKKSEWFLGQYISPILRWKKENAMGWFEGWIDWDWDSWIKEEFAHTVATITPEMRKRWNWDDEN
ncbi:uncharacterized protein N7459_004426 [Penicillium hispanicum]|uniref:uncharacterized protein n=1 Tax=Penicillium hispanicum TaxID=1080232 RepID=UPI002540B6BD|nr:uncharacterized protein N7459_004426 [Penicillium hispanicum]KAJ5584626.1 hypothetical protein N7459_004426 [Penicillium hispanicum]